MKRVKRKGVFIVFLLLLAFHLLGILGFTSHFQFGTGRPVLTDDYSWRSLLMSEVRDLFRSSGRLWGYSPFHMAGYPYGPLALSNRGEQCLALLFLFVDAAELFKIYTFLVLASSPFLIYLAGRILGLERTVCLLSSFWALLFFWNFPIISMARWGIISQIFVFFLAPLLLGYLHQFLQSGRLRYALSLFAISLIALTFHLSIIPALILPCAVLFFMKIRQLNSRKLFLLFILLSGLFGLCTSWLGSTLKARQWLDVSLYLQEEYYEKESFLRIYFGGDFSHLALLILGIWGLWRWRVQRKPVAFSLGSGILFCLSVIYLPFFKATFLIQPIRYDILLTLFLSLPASDFIFQEFKALINWFRQEGFMTAVLTLNRVRPVAVCGMILLALITSNFWRYPFCVKKLFIREKNFSTAGPLPTSFVPFEQERFVQWIRENTTPSARLLIEDSSHKVHAFWGSHLPALLPSLVQRELIGGPMPDIPLHHHFASFQDGNLFHKPIQQIRSQQLKEYFNLYNIGWVICHTEVSKSYFEKLSSQDIQKEAEIGDFTCYRVNRKGNFFLKGSGKLRADFDLLRLSDIQPEDGEIILAYHWMEDFKTVPTCPLVRTPQLDDPIGFIRILDPPEQLEIRFQP